MSRVCGNWRRSSTNRKKPRHVVSRGLVGERGQEHRLAGPARGLGHGLADARLQGGVAVDAAQVEEDAHPQHALRIRQAGPALEMAQPARQRLPPLRRGRHDPARAVGVAAGVQAVADFARQLGEIRFGAGGRVVGVDDAVVLVGAQALLLARLGSRMPATPMAPAPAAAPARARSAAAPPRRRSCSSPAALPPDAGPRRASARTGAGCAGTVRPPPRAWAACGSARPGTADAGSAG